MTSYYCPYLYSTLDFAIDGLYHCCHNIKAKERPQVKIPFSGGKFPLDHYMATSEELMDGVSKGFGSCKGCLYIQEGEFDRKFLGFTSITINCYNNCNISCFYCAHTKNKLKQDVEDLYYNPLPTLSDMAQLGLINSDCTIIFGGGEPALFRYLPEILEFIVKEDFKTIICTNATIWSEPIANTIGVGNKYREILVSVDSGCPISYKDVKGFDLFEKMVANLKKYAKVGKVSLKYIINRRASDKTDLEGFQKLAAEIKPERVVIAADIMDYFSNAVEFRKLHDAAYDYNKYKNEYKNYYPFARQLNKALLADGHKVQYLIWTPEDFNKLFLD